MLEPFFSAYGKGYLLHEQRKRVLEEFQVSCPIQTVWNDDRSQQIISKNSTPDVYVESRLVNSDEHCVRILVVPGVAVSAVEVAISCEAGLISKQDLCRKCRIHDAPLQKTTGQFEHEVRCHWATVLVFSGGGMHGSFVLARLAALKNDLNPWHGQWYVC